MFYNGNYVSYGHEGTVMGPADAKCSRPFVKMKFENHKIGTDVLLENLSDMSPVSPTHARLLCPLGQRL